MTEIRFHFNVADRTDYVCRLLRKATRQGATVVVVAGEALLDELDQALWTFDPLEFLPHARWREAAPPAPALQRATPVWLATDPAAVPAHEVLVNLGSAPPRGFESFGRLIEIVGQSEDDRGAARERWRHYAARGYPIEGHQAGG